MPELYKVGTLFVRIIRKCPLCVAGVRNDRRFLIVAAKCYEKLHFVILINKSPVFGPPKLFSCSKFEEHLVPHNRSHLILGVDLCCFVNLGLSL